MPNVLSFIYGHFFSDFQAPDVDLSGKVAIVTGSNVGEYLELCRQTVRHSDTFFIKVLDTRVRSTLLGMAFLT